MINGKPVTAFIPVRSGSKGVPGKNLKRLGKDTLLVRAIKQARASKYVDRILVSTNDSEMYTIAKEYDVATSSPRPEKLATDDAGTIDVILYTLNEMGINQGYLLLLQVTTPLRTIADIDSVCELFERNISTTEAVVSVTPTTSHPDKVQVIDEGYLKSYLGQDSHVARQSLPEVFDLNGSCYLTEISLLINQRTFIPDHTLPYIMPADRSINIDTMLDWYLLEKLVADRIVSIEEYDD